MEKISENKVKKFLKTIERTIEREEDSSFLSTSCENLAYYLLSVEEPPFFMTEEKWGTNFVSRIIPNNDLKKIIPNDLSTKISSFFLVGYYSGCYSLLSFQDYLAVLVIEHFCEKNT